MAMAHGMHIAELTSLPAVVIEKQESIGAAIKVLTPHRGEVIIDYDELHWIQGTRARFPSEIAAQLRALEREAKEYLFEQWCKQNNS